MDTELDQELVERPWDRRTDEPEEWYRIFKDYYLVLGERRSLRNAFELFVRVEDPKQYEDVDPDNIRSIPSHWNEYARNFEWAKRALAYDEEKRPDFAALYVTMTLDYLRTHSMEAAHALVAALKSDRTRVQAANSILNRSGVPETTEVVLGGKVAITADDMAEASDKVQAWQKRTQNPSG
jgi:hypothetical protein